MVSTVHQQDPVLTPAQKKNKNKNKQTKQTNKQTKTERALIQVFLGVVDHGTFPDTVEYTQYCNERALCTPLPPPPPPTPPVLTVSVCVISQSTDFTPGWPGGKALGLQASCLRAPSGATVERRDVFEVGWLVGCLLNVPATG